MNLIRSQPVRSLFATALMFAGIAPLHAQQTTGSVPVAQANKTQPQTSTGQPVPQISPIVHRLSGLKVLNLLRRNGVKVAPLSDEALLTDSVQTSITAGLSLGDGNLVARLPRAVLEIYEMPRGVDGADPTGNPSAVPAQATLVVIGRDGSEVTLTFKGLDGGTGLSLLSSGSSNLATPSRDVKEETLTLGQHVRIIATNSLPKPDGLTSVDVFVNIAFHDGSLKEINRGPSGSITRLVVASPNLTAECIGGVVVNDAGESIGFVDRTNQNEGFVIPMAGVRRAVGRILLGLEGKHRPWLGARGTPVMAGSLEELELAGWKRADAAKLIANKIGVVLTSVPRQTPAWNAKLRAGDVVTRVNGDEVESAERFSSLLAQADSKTPVRFTVVSPGRITPRIVQVRLSETLDPVLEMEATEQRDTRHTSSDPFVTRGMETVPVTATLATQLKARSGVYVVFVHPNSAAADAGILAGDVIEAVNTELLTVDSLPGTLPNRLILDVVRNGQRLTIKIETPIVLQPKSRR